LDIEKSHQRIKKEFSLPPILVNLNKSLNGVSSSKNLLPSIKESRNMDLDSGSLTVMTPMKRFETNKSNLYRIRKDP
jgi:hypothetical protein